MYNDIGKKIKYFRLRNGLSQLDLELALGAAQGSISRMESGRVNPTKETVNHIADILKLNSREQALLLLSIQIPPSKEEIDMAVDAVSAHFQKQNVFAYLNDDRFRFWAFSKGFINLFGALLRPESAEEIVRRLTGVSIIRLLLDPSLGISQFFDQGEAFEQLLYSQLSRIYIVIGDIAAFDPEIEKDFELVKAHPLASRVWDRIRSNPADIYTLQAKSIPFNIKGVKINLSYSREPLPCNPRFQVIEYVPTNKLLKVVLKYVK